MSRHPTSLVERPEAESLLDLLSEGTEDDGVAWLEARCRRRVSGARVVLVTEDCSPGEALSFAQVLVELGRHEEAQQVVLAVLAATLGMASIAQDERCVPNR